MGFLNYFSQIFSGGDWPVYYEEAISLFSLIPQVWEPTAGNGLGQNIAYALGVKTYFVTLSTFFVNTLGLPWSVAEKLIFFIPFWAITIFSSYYLSSYFFSQRWQRILSIVIFSTNTYALMILGGGQMGVALAYGVAPLVLVLFLKSRDEKSCFSNATILTGAFFGFQLFLDPRIAGITLFAAFLLSIPYFFNKKNLHSLLIIFLLSVLLNLFWILPFAFLREIPLGAEYTGERIAKFLSFAFFENSISIQHPNWPENIFGKVSFMRAEFLLLPIIAFSSILFIEKRTKHFYTILILTLVGLIGAFLAKGANDPGGDVYLWLFKNIPGFVLFRDSTKWYLLIVLSFSVLIPFSLDSFAKKIQVYENVNVNKFHFTNPFARKKNIHIFFAIVFVVLWAFTIRDAFLGKLKGTFYPAPIPKEYLRLTEMISSQNEFFRTLWVPQKQRYGYNSVNHPAINASNITNEGSVSAILEFLHAPDAEKFLRFRAVKYVIVPYDTKGEFFIKDRIFDPELFKKTKSEVKKINYLDEIGRFSEMQVLELVQKTCSRFYILQNGDCIPISYRRLSSTMYAARVNYDLKAYQLIFSESYDGGWVVIGESGKEYSSLPFDTDLNSFLVDGEEKSLTIIYKPQKYVHMGLFVSGTTALIIFFLIINFYRKR